MRFAALGISGAAHAGAVAWVIGSGAPATDAGQPAEVVASVALMSQAAFDALVSSPPVVAADIPPAPAAPEGDASPAVAEVGDAAPERSADRPTAPEADTPPPDVPLPPPLLFLSAPAELAELARPDDPVEAGDDLAAAIPVAPRPSAVVAPIEDAPPAADAPPVPDKAAARPGKAKDKKAGKAKPHKEPSKTAAAPPSAAPVGGLSDGALDSAMSEWGGKLRSRINRAKTYPASARAAGQEGRVSLSLKVAPTGQVLAVAVAQSSGVAELDQAAVDAVRRAGQLPAAPKGLADSAYSFTLAVSFNL